MRAAAIQCVGLFATVSQTLEADGGRGYLQGEIIAVDDTGIALRPCTPDTRDHDDGQRFLVPWGAVHRIHAQDWERALAHPGDWWTPARSKDQ